jgi:hypothetical protein
MTNRGGIVLDTGDAFRFLPASIAALVAPAETIVPVPGLASPAVGLVLTDERVATALQVGTKDTEHMVVCEIEGEWVALVGAWVIATGTFEASMDGFGVLWAGVVAQDLDVRSLTLDVEASIWRTSGLTDGRRG